MLFRSDNCVESVCTYVPIEGCCLDDSDCVDDGSLCTAEVCIANICGFIGKDCDDGIECTIDSCVWSDGSCVSDTQACVSCLVDADCDDGDDSLPILAIRYNSCASMMWMKHAVARKIVR